jgi:wyosine [tRNA(Phe)-imidazoG37] synthetase (radical SAM superfamily)
VLTNGSLLSDPDVRRDLLSADVVLPTLSTVNKKTFQKIHRPVPEINTVEVFEGLIQFRNEYTGQIWLEVFIIPGVNTSDEELVGLHDAIREIRPDRVQLNTLDRPGTEDWVRPADPAELERILKIIDFSSAETVELPDYPTLKSQCAEDTAGQVCELLKRLPCTVDDITAVTGMHHAEVHSSCGRWQRQKSFRRTGRTRVYFIILGISVSG